jgi:hypothetical protein
MTSHGFPGQRSFSSRWGKLKADSSPDLAGLIKVLGKPVLLPASLVHWLNGNKSPQRRIAIFS